MSRNRQLAFAFLLGFGLIMALALLYIIQHWGTEQFWSRQRGPVKVYYADNISPAHQQLIQKFNDRHRGQVEIVPVNLPFTKFSTNERKELLARSLRSKSDRIDLFTVDIIWVPRFARWAEPLQHYFSEKELNQILDHALKTCFVENELVAIPLYTDVGLMYYRRDLLARLPDARQWEEKLRRSITWEEFLQLKDRMARYFPDIPFFLFPANNYEGLICSYVELVQQGGARLAQSGRVNLQTPAHEKALQLLVDLVHRYHATPIRVVNYDEYLCYLDALQHQAIFLRGWPGFLKHYRDAVSDTSLFHKFALAPLPHLKGSSPMSVYGGWNFMIPRNTPKKKYVLQFIRFCLQPENQKILFEAGGYIPVNKAVFADSAYVKRYPRLQFYERLIRNGIHRPYLVNYTRISDVISYYLHLAIRGDISVPRALAEATRVINDQKVLVR